MGEAAASLEASIESDAPLRTLGRRLLTIPLHTALAALFLLSAPLWIPLAALVDVARPGKQAALRCGVFFTMYFLYQVAGIVMSFGLWLVGGPWTGAARERYHRRNVVLKWWWASGLLLNAGRIFGIRWHLEGTEHLTPSPIVLLIRHASMGDTLLPAVFIEKPNDMDFRYVLKRELLWDPCIDIVGNRLHCYFVRRGSDDSAREVRAVGDLMEGLQPDEGFMIYPEGTRFTPEKRERVLRRLRESADPGLVARAERLQHVLPPRLGGTLASLERNPGADVVVCAHTGFENVATFSDLWRGRLVDRDILIEFWRIPCDEIPSDREARIDWLFALWSRVDEWVATHRGEVEARR